MPSKQTKELAAFRLLAAKSGFRIDPISLKKDPNFENLKKLISQFPKPVLEIIFFESNIAFLWKEKKDLEMLEHIKSIFN
jgi:hypothetical protein